MKRKLLLVSMGMVLALLFAQAAFAWGGGPRFLSSDSWVNMADRLNLTGEQAQKIQDIQKKAFTSMQEQRAKMRQLCLSCAACSGSRVLTGPRLRPKSMNWTTCGSKCTSSASSTAMK